MIEFPYDQNHTKGTNTNKEKKLQSECTVTVKRIIWTCAYEFAPELNGFHGLYLLCTRLIGTDSICIMYHVSCQLKTKFKTKNY